MTVPFLQIDAFTEEPFSGNPAAVCLLEPGAAVADYRLQAVAGEMNLSETAFITPRPGGVFGLRWFTPRTEVDLCGHATLAAAAAVREWGLVDTTEPIHFESRSGRLTCTNDGDLITLDLPAAPAHETDKETWRTVAALLAIEPVWLGVSTLNYLIAELGDEREVAVAAPDMASLGSLPYVGLVITARSGDSRFDFVSRFFAPAVGVPEDPVCGSAHCTLGPIWADRLRKTELWAHQISARRGVLRVRPRGERVQLAGHASLVLRGELLAKL